MRQRLVTDDTVGLSAVHLAPCVRVILAERVGTRVAAVSCTERASPLAVANGELAL